jgi:hypothetical protein
MKDVILGAVAGMIVGAMIFMMTAGCAHGAEQQRRFYDDRGRSVGTSSTDSQGNTTFRDARGKVIGKASK